MAITATFTANFSSFTKAVEQAEVQLKDLETGAAKVDKSLSRMAESFSGKKIIQEATLMAKAIGDVENVSKLTETEMRRVAATTGEAIAKLKALGKDVPPGIQKLADATKNVGVETKAATEASKGWGGAFATLTTLAKGFIAVQLVSFLKDAVTSSLEYADALSNLSARTRISVEDLQKLEAVGRPASVSMDDMATAAAALFKNLDSKAGKDAIEKLGLDYATLRSLKPADMMLEIGIAIQKIEDPVEAANASTALFGKTFSAVAASMTDDAKKAAASATTLSEAQVKSLDMIGDMWDELTDRVSKGTKSWIADMGLRLLAYKNLYDYIKGSPMPALDPPKPPPNNLKPVVKSWITDMEEVGRVAKEMNDQISEAAKKREQVEKKAADESKKAAAMVDASLERIRYGYFKLGQAALQAAKDTSPLLMRTSELILVSEDYSKELNEAQIVTDQFGNTVARAAPSLGDLGQGVINVGQKVNNFTESLKKLPSLLVKAFTGGGGVKGAINALGAEIGSGLFSEGGALAGAATKATKGLTKVFGSTVGGALGAAIPGIGALIGPAFEKLAGWIGSLFGNKTKDAIVSSFGSYDALREKLAALGAEGERMWIRLTQQTGRNDLASTKAQIDEINAALGLQATAMQSVDEVAKKYGLTIEELGPAWAKQELDKKAQELFKDYQILNSAGVDHVTVLTKMSGAVNEYVATALKMGQEVPEAMRPMLEAMVQNGTLLDANGNKVTDLEAAGVKFAMTMSDGFKSLISEVQKLTDIIARSLGVSLDTVHRKADAANEAMQDGFKDSAKEAEKLADEVDGISYGHSPGGLKDIIAMSDRATSALVRFGKDAGKLLAKAGKDVDTLAKKLGGLKPPKGWKGEAKDTYTDIARQIAILTAGSELAKDKLRLKFDEEDEIAAISGNKELTKAEKETLIAMVRRKYDILLAQLLDEYRREMEEDRRRAEEDAADEAERERDRWRPPPVVPAPWAQLRASGGGAADGAGSSVVVNIDASGAFFDTPASLQALADKVGAALTADLRRQVRFAST